MADVFDIDSGGYHPQAKNSQVYSHRSAGGWIAVDSKNTPSRKDPRLARRDEGRKRFSRSPSPRRGRGASPRKPADNDAWHSSPRVSKPGGTQMYGQGPAPTTAQPYQHPQPTTMYPEYNSAYPQPTASAAYQQHNAYQQSYQFNQYSSGAVTAQSAYTTGYGAAGAPLADPTGWTTVTQAYGGVASHHHQQHQAPPPPHPVPRPSGGPSTNSSTSSSVGGPSTTEHKPDELKKEAAIAQERKQQRATLMKQREEYIRKASVLRRELDKLRAQKHGLLADPSPPRDRPRVLRENAKLQLEIQNKLKTIHNVVDMLSGIIGDGVRPDERSPGSSSSSLKAAHDSSVDDDDDNDTGGGGTAGGSSNASAKEKTTGSRRGRDHLDEDFDDDDEIERATESSQRFNFVHYDPELHWCRACDVFPRTAKDLLMHLQSTEHRHLTHEQQLVDMPWHKLPPEQPLPSSKGARVKRVPIKGLQFFISTTAWYCRLCDMWIGDLHCASIHLKSRAHTTNYSNFVEQNPHWETNWLKDRKKAYARCMKTKSESGDTLALPAPDANDKSGTKHKKRKEKHDSFIDNKEKKRKKKTKKRKKNTSSGSSSSSSSSSESSSEDESTKAKSIRVAMRNKMRMQAQMILNEELGGKLEALGRLVEEEKLRKKDSPGVDAPTKTTPPPPPLPPPPPPSTQPTQSDSAVEDSIINQWMNVTTPTNDKIMLDSLKGRFKQRQEADKEKALEAAAEQRRREREREERELKEMREREQRELEEKQREEREREEHDREERERAKERERNRRRRRSESRSPDHYRGRSRSRSRGRSRSRARSHSRGRSRSRSRSVGRRRYPRRSPPRYESRHSPDDKYKSRRDYDDDDSRNSPSPTYKSRRSKHSSSSSSTRKLPFIGRMPVYKKKSDGDEKEIKQEEYEVRLSKFEPGYTARAFIPEPGVAHITRLATPQEPPPIKLSAENPPPPPQIIPEPPKISQNIAPPSPPIINDIRQKEVVTDQEPATGEIQDMELDEAAPPLPPGVPVAEAKPLAKPAGNHLPRDFQEALNIIFPGDQMPEHLVAAQNDPNLMMQYQYGMGYGMMYPSMQMYEYDSENTGGTVAATSEDTAETEAITNKTEAPLPDDKSDLAMLGIDAEDMAAQTI